MKGAALRRNHRLSRIYGSVRRVMGSALIDLQALDTAPPHGLSRIAAGVPDNRQHSWAPLLVANAVIAAGFAAVAVHDLPPLPILWWTNAAIAASVLPAAFSIFRGRAATVRATARFNEAWAILVGLIWAALPLLFFDSASPNVRVLAVGLVFALSSIGTLALATLPRAAILFCTMITASLVLCAAKLGGNAGLALGFMTVFYYLSAAGMILRSHDASVRRAGIEQEVKKQNEIIALLLNDFSDGNSDWLWETGRDGQITYASRGLAAGLGISPAAVIGRSLDEVLTATDELQGWHDLKTALMRRKAIEQAAVELPFARGKTWWQITARPMFSSDGTFHGYRGVAHDITDEHHSNQQLLEAKEAAERSSATKSQFLAVMSHELRTPLNAIIGFAGLLGSPQAENLSFETRADHLRTIQQSSLHLQNLISDILDATRIEKGTMTLAEQETDAAELVEVAVKMCREAAERADNTVVARIIDGIEIQGDMTRLKQVLINLITNALKFSPPGGFVNVAFERRADDGLAVAVRDNGVGIRSEDLTRIFEPYVQADEGMARRFGGAGLGLAIARRIATLHGGDVTIESQFGVGTTARLVLPASRVVWPKDESKASTRAA